ncbi:MAG: FeoB-associated Cys-rich membrane protein [Muribaculaceae bacterium]|nr:FeoB-associated Cys-rich membrane protein [Muribaculaceae bacterium]
MSETMQYIIVGSILLASVVWIIVKFRRKRHGKDSGCCGCSLQESCCSKKKNPSWCDKTD